MSFFNPQTMQQALCIALIVEQAEKEEPSNESVYTKFESTFRDRPKTALRCYECQGIGHFTKECPARQKRRGKRQNSPGKKNPSES